MSDREIPEREQLGLWIPSEERLARPDETFGLGAERMVVRVGDRTKIYWRYCLPDGVQVAALNPAGELAVITEYVVGNTSYRQHLVGGTCDVEGESPAATAARELQEETGLQGQLHLLASVLQDSQRSRRLFHYFLATDCRKVGEPEQGISLSFCNLDSFQRLLVNRMLDVDGQPQSGLNSITCLTLAQVWLAGHH